MAHQAASSTLNEDKIGNDRKQLHLRASTVLQDLTVLQSFLVRPFQGSPSSDKPISNPDASPTRWHRS